MLKRQLRRLGLSPEQPPNAEQWRVFVERVERAYAEAERHRYTLERSLMLSSSEMRELYGSLQRSEANLRTVLDRSPDLVFVSQEDDTLCYVNRTLVDALGYSSSDELLGRPAIETLVCSEDWECARSHRRERLAGERSIQFSLRFRRHDGQPLPVEVVPATIEWDNAVAGVVLARDVREQRLLEEQLRQSQKMEAIGLLAGGIAHDFNNLLTVILGYTDLQLEELPQDSSLYAEIGEIDRAAKLASTLTRQLLVFSRKQVLRPEVVDLNEVVRSTERMLRRVLGRDIRLVLRTTSVAAVVYADPGQLEQVLLNLVVNARDAVDRNGEVWIETAVVTRSEPSADGTLPSGRYAVLRVGDNGCGMDSATRARIFEPFFTTKERGRGTGLGLATVFGIVRQSGGHIAVSSEVGVGTTFDILLPETGLSAEPPVAGKQLLSLRPNTATILVVEDETPVRNIIVEVLRREGFALIEAQNAGEAFLICERHPKPIDLMLTDIVMPRMTGRELAERVALLRPEMKLLLMSGFDDGELEGAVASVPFLPKPIAPATLRQKVREVLGQA